MSEGNDFIDWQGGICPVELETLVEVKFSGGGPTTARRPAGVFNWAHNHYNGDIIAYRVIEAPKPQVNTPDGFTPWSGGEIPVGFWALVSVVLRNGNRGSCPAADLNWSHTGSTDDIIAYRVVEAAKPKVEIPEGFTPWAGGECPVDPDTGVDVILADGTSGGSEAKGFDWSHVEGRGVNILAYRADKPQTARDIQIGGTHYKKSTVQPWDVVDTWPIEQQIGFHRGNALKYVMRLGTKDENLREIRKAAHYLQKLVEVLEQKGGV